MCIRACDWSLDFPSPYSLVFQTPLNNPVAALSFRELKACLSFSSLSLTNSLIVFGLHFFLSKTYFEWLSLVEGDPHWWQHVLGIQLRSVFSFNNECNQFYFGFLSKNKKNPSFPLCSQVSKESRGELVQRSCNIQLQTAVEEFDVRTKDASTTWLMREIMGLGRCGARLSTRCETSKDSFSNQFKSP